MTIRRMEAAASSSRQQRARRRVLLAGLAFTGGLWSLTLLVHSGHLAGSDALAPATSPVSMAGTSALLWMVMMAAMMTPAALPWLSVLAATPRSGVETRGAGGLGGDHGERGSEAPYLRAGTLLLGYLTVWALFSVLAAAAQLFLLQLALMESHTLRLGGRSAGAVLLLAGFWELSPIKEACLKHCRSPFGVLLANWSQGPASGYRIGLRHGLTCLGCCWALMALAFVAGLVSLGWMAVLTAVVCAEMLLPRGQPLTRVLGVALASAGVALLAWPG